jgi:uncharacterized protein (DUF2249 family)
MASSFEIRIAPNVQDLLDHAPRKLFDALERKLREAAKLASLRSTEDGDELYRLTVSRYDGFYSVDRSARTLTLWKLVERDAGTVSSLNPGGQTRKPPNPEAA